MTGNIPTEIAKRTKEEYENKPDILKVYTCSWFIGLLLDPKDRTYLHSNYLKSSLQLIHYILNQANSTTTRQLDISYPTIEFTKLVKSWDGYQADKMGIILRHVKAKDLPFFVKPASAKKANGAGTKLVKGKSLKRAKSEKVRNPNLLDEFGCSARPSFLASTLTTDKFNSTLTRQARIRYQKSTTHRQSGYDLGLATLTCQGLLGLMTRMEDQRPQVLIRQHRHQWLGSQPMVLLLQQQLLY